MGGIIFIVGLILGSFANVILLRYNTGESIVKIGSRCFSCARRLSWFELIPIFSFLALRGRCRTCKSRISIRYLLIEIGTALLFALLFYKLQGAYAYLVNFQFSVFIASVLFILAWFFLWIAALYDLRHMILPDRFIIGAALLGLLGSFIFLGFSPSMLYRILSGIAASAFFFLLWRLSGGRWMGAGDAKYIFPFALLMPPISFFGGVLAAFIIGSIVGIVLILLGRKRLQSHIPFGPFIFLGGLAGFLIADQVIHWYIGFWKF